MAKALFDKLERKWMDFKRHAAHPKMLQSSICGGDWSSLAGVKRSLSAVSVCPACCLLLYTPRGRARTHSNTPTHADVCTHALSISPLCRTQTHHDMHSGLAYIIRAAETDQTPVHTC